MQIDFPKYPFIWNYDDMYNPLDFSNKILEKPNIQDQQLLKLIELFPDYIVVEQKQKIKKEDAVNISIHTWYLSKLRLFESDDHIIKIESDSVIKFKKEVFGFIFDPNNVLDKTFRSEKKKNNPIFITSNITSIKKHMIPNVYLHTHNIKGIFRFSPRDNSLIKFNQLDNTNTENSVVFYTVLEGLITINTVSFI